MMASSERPADFCEHLQKRSLPTQADSNILVTEQVYTIQMCRAVPERVPTSFTDQMGSRKRWVFPKRSNDKTRWQRKGQDSADGQRYAQRQPHGSDSRQDRDLFSQVAATHSLVRRMAHHQADTSSIILVSREPVEDFSISSDYLTQ